MAQNALRLTKIWTILDKTESCWDEIVPPNLKCLKCSKVEKQDAFSPYLLWSESPIFSGRFNRF